MTPLALMGGKPTEENTQITKKSRADGSIAYLCRIASLHNGERVSRSRTFDNKKTAVAWGKREEKSFRTEIPDILAHGSSQGKPTLGDAIARYIESSSNVGRTKIQVLRTLVEYPIASMSCHMAE